MTHRSKLLAAGAATLAIVGGGASLAIAGGFGGEDANESEAPIEGAALAMASAAALEHLGEGAVSATEVGDEESYYEVEVTLDDGSQVDVQLDRGFQVAGDETDSGDAGDDD